MEFIMFLVVLKKYKYSFTLCQSITKDTLFFPTNARNSMELVLRSISNTLRSFNFVIVEITAHSLSLSTEYQCHTYSRHCSTSTLIRLRHRSFSFFLFLLLEKKCELGGQCQNLGGRTKSSNVSENPRGFPSLWVF